METHQITFWDVTTHCGGYFSAFMRAAALAFTFGNACSKAAGGGGWGGQHDVTTVGVCSWKA